MAEPNQAKQKTGSVGPNKWVVLINKKAYYQLDPAPVFEAQRKARVIASAAGNHLLKITVRRTNQTEIKQWSASGTVTAEWNPGIESMTWEVRVYNVNGPDNLRVEIEASSGG